MLYTNNASAVTVVLTWQLKSQVHMIHNYFMMQIRAGHPDWHGWKGSLIFYLRVLSYLQASKSS